MTKAEISRNLRYKRPALSGLSYEDITNRLEDMQEACSEIHWAFADDDTLVDALDGNEEEAWEFKMLFGSLEAESYQLWEQITDQFGYAVDDPERTWNDFSVALIGNRFNVIGYDGYEEDYYSLCSYEQELAATEAGKRVMRLTKAEMLSQIGQILGMILAFHNIEMKYEALKATIDVLRERNTSIITQIKAIEQAYDKAQGEQEWSRDWKEFDRLISELPEQLWIT